MSFTAEDRARGGREAWARHGRIPPGRKPYRRVTAEEIRARQPARGGFEQVRRAREGAPITHADNEQGPSALNAGPRVLPVRREPWKA